MNLKALNSHHLIVSDEGWVIVDGVTHFPGDPERFAAQANVLQSKGFRYVEDIAGWRCNLMEVSVFASELPSGRWGIDIENPKGGLAYFEVPNVEAVPEFHNTRI